MATDVAEFSSKGFVRRNVVGAMEKDVQAVILIPAFNAEDTIVDTLTAIQRCQDFFKIIAVYLLDDASSDETVNLAKSAWHSTVPLEILINPVNMGERSTTNAALERIDKTISWAFIVHADDVVKQDWIRLYLDCIAKGPSDVATICSSYDLWYPDTNEIVSGEDNPTRIIEYIRGSADSVRDTLKRGCWWHLSGCAIRVEAFRAIGGFESAMDQLGDWEWLLRCLASGWSASYIPRSTMLYRQHARSVSAQSFRRGRDLEEKLKVLARYRRSGHLTATELQSAQRKILYSAARRAASRVSRTDMFGAVQLGLLFVISLVRYARGQL